MTVDRYIGIWHRPSAIPHAKGKVLRGEHLQKKGQKSDQEWFHRGSSIGLVWKIEKKHQFAKKKRPGVVVRKGNLLQSSL
ncbi:hypothetical protein BN938_1495 [Mucinivorans hirudinis]|uniref:Uncharacterized protein n=1 Tax=Mucinivorans hirudinis TaxID=1433126 RepID=A0A060R876_9BACT|nr:hypothetical protein BN938_1495 [Mucinivorans hirudinis]